MITETPGVSTGTSDNVSVKTVDYSTTDKERSEVTSPGDVYSTPTRQTDTSGTATSEGTKYTSVGISTEGSTTTEHLPELPPIVRPQPPILEPPNPFYPTLKPPRRKPERVSSETSEIVALIIGIIAAALIAVILIILVILKFKSRGERSYKVDDGKGYQQGPNAALLGNTSTNGQTQYQLNGALRNGDKGQLQKTKKRDSKDIKEWYV